MQRSGPPYEASPKELADALGVTSGTMTVRIDRVVLAGLVEAGTGRSDRRSRPVRLTEAGRDRWRTATAERTATEQALLGEALRTREIEQLNRLLTRLLGRLEEDLGPAPDHGPTRADET